MRLLVADDEDVTRLRLEALLTRAGHEVVSAGDGNQAWQILQRPDAPRLALLDWMMPGLDGIELCRKVRALPAADPIYLILLTSKGEKEHIVEGLQSGANDYITKPFDRAELQARVQVGCQVVALQLDLARRVRELEESLAEIKQLRGLLPICSYCKKIRNDHNYWEQVETYLGARSAVQFSHGICPECWDNVVVPELGRSQGGDPPTVFPDKVRALGSELGVN
jgi:sigma-B regulation protein RsbU (phosphoserine phosphatase)